MSKSNAFETAFLQLIFQAVAIPSLAEDESEDPVATLTVALHTDDPGEDGTQSTNELEYFGYSRQLVARSALGWTVNGNSVSPTAPINFPVSLGGAGGTVTHFSIGTGVDDFLLFSGTVTPNLTIVTSVAPQLTTASSITED
jgi:hypothetical protein